MPRVDLRRAMKCLLPALLVLSAANGCSCGTGIKNTQCRFTCCQDSDCQNKEKAAGDPNWMNWSCSDPNTAQSFCAQAMTACMVDSDCCPGQVCNQTISLCTDSFTQCSPDGGTAACSASMTPGEQCISPLGVFPKSPGCSFQSCQTSTDCPTGLSCFDNYCVGEAPCNGGCGANEVCTPVNNGCFNLLDSSGKPSTNFPASCEQTCAPGKILVFTNGLNVFQGCNGAASAVGCSCDTLPPIFSDSTALFSSSAVAGNQILISAYDEEFGDLVLHRFTKDDPNNPTELDGGSPLWIDGVPDGGPIVGDPNGPRGGTNALGPNVGEYTSIAFDDSSQTVHISYYDVADANGNPTGNLKYARSVLDGSGAPGPWTIMIVDGVDSSGNKTANVGMYSNITLAPDGSPVIAYFQNPGMGSSPNQSALWVARASSGTPMSAKDWTISQVDEADVPCGGGCSSSQACGAMSSSATPTCFATSTSCASTCSSTEFCGTDPSNSTPSCITSVTVTAPEAGLPAIGTGVFPSITYPPSDWPSAQRLPVVVWYKNLSQGAGTLWGAIASGDDATQGANFGGKATQLDNGSQTGGFTDDVGQFPSIAIGPMSVGSPIAVSYFDATAGQLKLITAQMPSWGSQTPSVVDPGTMSGTSDPEISVGADSSVKFNGSNIWIAYQDATGLSLRLAEQTSGPWQFSTLDMNEGTGFYAKLLIDTSSQYVSTAVVKADTATLSGDRLVVFRVP